MNLLNFFRFMNNRLHQFLIYTVLMCLQKDAIRNLL